jgi:hypothetical protein
MPAVEVVTLTVAVPVALPVADAWAGGGNHRAR